jgi:hypothetical protein
MLTEAGLKMEGAMQAYVSDPVSPESVDLDSRTDRILFRAREQGKRFL